MSILNLDQSPESDALKVLLALLVYEVATGYCPSLCDPRQWYGTSGWKVEIVCCAKRKIGEEFNISDAV